MVMKFHNFDIFYQICYIIDLSSALACRMHGKHLGYGRPYVPTGYAIRLDTDPQALLASIWNFMLFVLLIFHWRTGFYKCFFVCYFNGIDRAVPRELDIHLGVVC